MPVIVDGLFDDRPLAELGIPVIGGTAPDEPGISEVRVDGADDAAIERELRRQGCTLLSSAWAPPGVPPVPGQPTASRMQRWAPVLAFSAAVTVVVETVLHLVLH